MRKKAFCIFWRTIANTLLDNTVAYPGVRADRLKGGKGGAMAVLTNKPVRFSEEILELAWDFRGLFPVCLWGQQLREGRSRI